MKITAIAQIDTDFMHPEDFSKVLDLTLADARREMVQRYAEYCTEKREKA